MAFTFPTDSNSKAGAVDSVNSGNNFVVPVRLTTDDGVTKIDGTNRFPVVVASEDAPGGSVPAVCVVVGGSDGTNTRMLKTDASGDQIIVGVAAHDAAAAGNPVQVGGVYRATDPAVADGDAASLRVNPKGEAIVEVSGQRSKLLISYDNDNALIANEQEYFGQTAHSGGSCYPLDVSAYPKKSFYVANNYDQAIIVGAQSFFNTSAYDSLLENLMGSGESLASGAYKFWNAADVAELGYPLLGLKVYTIRGASAPTTGNIDVHVIGGF